ncbi:XdhC family protein [Luteibacter aegosomatissinici]|uniref:XdhC family protein n=1 Tax=Luteibacter aegosomatissinici TaxID=2911539 RepID=UPI001FF80D5A|nr:XdhC family protein [Luteibacter aegosomatissinici]UPG93394.1 XdhC family protein [Luteibacter aegosomatissinici]
MKSYDELRRLALAWRGLADSPGERAALVTIVHTSGSTFRRVGAAMLVRADGSIVNPLAGGCPQRAIVERSLQVMASGELAYAAYNAEQGLDVLLEAGCGGELEVAIEPLAPVVPSFVDELDAILATSKPFQIVTHFPASPAMAPPTRTCTPLPVDGFAATCDNVESERLDGGTRLIETFDAPVSLVVAGACHEAVELAALAARMGWRGIVVDTSAYRLAQVALDLTGWQALEARPENLAATVRLDGSTALVSMTHNLDLDIAYLRAGAAFGAFYLGALGSQRRARTIASAVPAAALRVPAGLDIGSNTSREIGLAIVAEIMATRHKRDGQALSHTGRPIH